MAGHLNALGLPVHLDEQAELEEELEDITSRLKRTLNRFDDEYEEEEDHFETDEREAFQARYESMTTRMEAMAQERSALLSSIAEWLDTSGDVDGETPSRPESRSSPKTPESGHPDKVMFDSVVTARMGVQKLKQLNENMVQQAVRGKDMEHMAKEEAQLQKKVVTKFKKMMDDRKRNVIGKTFGAHWKHASEEICSLLARIRKEGGSGIDELGAQLERASRAIQRQAEEMQRLEQKVHDKDTEISTLTNEKDNLSAEVELLTSEKQRYRNQIMKYRKRMRQRQQEAMTPQEEKETFSDGEEEELKRLVTPTTPVITPTQPRQKKIFPEKQKRTTTTSKKKMTKSTTPASSSEPKAPEQERPPTPDRAGGSKFDENWHLEEENFTLKDKVLQLEKKVIEKEHKMISLEHQVHELVESIKDSNPALLGEVFADLERRGQSMQDVATAIRNSVSPATLETSAKRYERNGSARQMKSASPRQTPTPDLARSSAPSPSAAPQQVQPEVDPELIQQLRDDKKLLTQELQNAKIELKRAQFEVLSLRQTNSQRGVLPSFPTNSIGNIASKVAQSSKASVVASGHMVQQGRSSPSMKRMLLESHGREDYDVKDEESNTTRKALANIRMQDYLPPVQGTGTDSSNVEYDDEFQALADMIRAEAGEFKQWKYTRPKMIGNTDGRKSVASPASKQVEYEEYRVQDQGMQTDPTMDPLGAWSNVPTIKMDSKQKMSKKIVQQTTTAALPPKEWELFDPTAFQDVQRLTYEDIFVKKPKPKSMDNASDLINFVESELRRLTQGISGYTSYLNNLIEKEVSSMADTNKCLRKTLSDATLKNLDKMRDLVSQGKDGGQKGDEKKKSRGKEAPKIRRGRFEISKPGKVSRYNTKRAFGSFFAGRRFVIQQGGMIPEQLQTQQLKSPGQAYPWETYAKEHIYKAEMEAAERQEQETRSGSRGPSDILKLQVDQIAKHAIDVLQGTTTFFKETLSNQLEEFDALQGAVQLKDDIKTMRTGESRQQGDKVDSSLSATPLLTRSASLGSFQEQKPVSSADYRDTFLGTPGLGSRAATQMDELFMPSQSQSMSSIQSSHRYLPPLLVYKEPEPRNRNQYTLPKATLPKKGMVTIAVTNMYKSTQNEQDKAYDPKRRHRPAPQTHQKLHTKQMELINKVVKEPEEDSIEDTTLLDLRNQALLLPGGLFGSSNQESDSMKPSQDKQSPERKQLVVKATEQLREGEINGDKYTAIFAQSY